MEIKLDIPGYSVPLHYLGQLLYTSVRPYKWYHRFLWWTRPINRVTALDIDNWKMILTPLKWSWLKWRWIDA